MKILLGGTPVQNAPPAAVTIGNFDGVHLGHRHILQRLKSEAAARGLQSTAVVFEPQPAEFFARLRGSEPPPRLTPLRDKLRLLHESGCVDNVRVLRFNRAFSQMPAEDFIEHILQRELKHPLSAGRRRFPFRPRPRGQFRPAAKPQWLRYRAHAEHPRGRHPRQQYRRAASLARRPSERGGTDFGTRLRPERAGCPRAQAGTDNRQPYRQHPPAAAPLCLKTAFSSSKHPARLANGAAWPVSASIPPSAIRADKSWKSTCSTFRATSTASGCLSVSCTNCAMKKNSAIWNNSGGRSPQTSGRPKAGSPPDKCEKL